MGVFRIISLSNGNKSSSDIIVSSLSLSYVKKAISLVNTLNSLGSKRICLVLFVPSIYANPAGFFIIHIGSLERAMATCSRFEFIKDSLKLFFSFINSISSKRSFLVK